MDAYVLALDQGTTSSRAILFDHEGNAVAKAQHPFEQLYPQPGWVEHDPMEILRTQLLSAAEALQAADIPASSVCAVGITNQRETTLVWEKSTGRPVCNAIVWQCRRTAPLCERLSAAGLDSHIREKTGLILDPYFSATKIRWILDAIPDGQRRAENGELLFGTVDSWLIWNLTGRHVTDVSNASRTMLFDIHTLLWDERICAALRIPLCMLPRPVSNSEIYGRVQSGLPGLEALAGVPVCGAAGDQQSALLGQGCLTAGRLKNTYGTGCFTLMNVGDRPLLSQNGLVTSVAWTIGGKTSYALEGSVFNAGSTIQWLRDELGLISTAAECDRLAEQVPDNGGVYLVSAFTGLGAPWWDPYARGTVVGLTRGSGRAHLARAALEGIAFQVADLIEAMSRDALCSTQTLCVDGGASVSDFMMQWQADLLQCPVDRPQSVETTALGAAFLAGLAAGVWSDVSEVRSLRKTQRVFRPQCSPDEAAERLRRWHRAVNRSRAWLTPEENGEENG